MLKLIVLLSVFAFGSLVLYAAEPKKETINVYVNSNIDINATYSRWQPTIDTLNKTLRRYELKLLPIEADRIDEIKRLLDKRKIDFLITQPAIYSELEYTNGISRILTMANKYDMSRYGSVFIVNKNSKIKKIDDITHKNIAAVTPLSFGGWLVGYNELFKNGIDPLKDDKVTFLGSQKAVVESIIDNRFDVGIIRSGILEQFSKSMNISSIRVVNEQDSSYPVKLSTKLFPEWAFAVAPHVDNHTTNEIFKALNKITQTDEAAIKGQYAHWHLPENYSDVDKLLKKFELAQYSNIPPYEHSYFLYITLGLFILAFGFILWSIKLKKEINSRKKMQIMLLETNKKLQMYDKIISSSSDYMSFVDNQYRYVTVNEAYLSIMNRKRQDIENHYVKEIVGEKNFNIIEPYLTRALKGETIKYHEWFVYPIGKVYLQATYTPYISKDSKKIEGVVVNVNDATELHEKDEIMLLQSRSAAMGEMISLIAHQWRQPISTISMEANNILADIELDTLDINELKNIAESINQNIQELSKTIDDFKNFFKPTKDLADIDIKEVLKSTIEIVGKSLESHNIQLITAKHKEYKVIKTYSRELMQVFINIINNAKDAIIENATKSAKIFIECNSMDNTMTILISDNAGGIEQNILPKIFEPYFSTKHKKNGTGLGLYMSKMIIEKHLNGTIEAYNNELGGATFKIELPINLEQKSV